MVSLKLQKITTVTAKIAIKRK